MAMSTSSKNVKLHRRGVMFINSFLPSDDLDVQLAPQDGVGNHYPDTDIIVVNKKSQKRYEVRVPTTSRDNYSTIPAIGKGYTWLLNEGNFKVSDPSFIYCFTILKSAANAKDRVFIVPSEVVARNLESAKKYHDRKGLSPENHIFWFFIGDRTQVYPTPVFIPYEDEYENNRSVFS